MLVKDIMTPEVISVEPDAAVGDIAELLTREKISAVPVLSGDGKLLGIVSEGDLIRRLSGDADDHRPWWVAALASPADDAKDFLKSHGRTAKEVMTTNVVTVEEDTDLGKVAHLLEANRIKRAPVVRGDVVVGMVSRSNLLQAVARGTSAPVNAPAPTDRQLRTNVQEALRNKGFSTHGAINVIVEGGVVELWGYVESDAERDALILAAKEVEGVKEVRDHFGRVSPWLWGT